MNAIKKALAVILCLATSISLSLPAAAAGGGAQTNAVGDGLPYETLRIVNFRTQLKAGNQYVLCVLEPHTWIYGIGEVDHYIPEMNVRLWFHGKLGPEQGKLNGRTGYVERDYMSQYAGK